MASASYHARSISLPTRSNPLTLGVEEQINKLRASQATASSANPSIICQNLVALKDLYNQVDDLIHFPLMTSDKCVNDVVDGSLSLVDVCETTRDLLSEMKQSVQDLQSALRRKSSLANDVSAYKASKKKVICKCLANLKRMQNKHAFSTPIENDQQQAGIINVLKEAEELTSSVIQSILSFVSGPKAQSKSFFSKLMHPKRVGCEVENQAELEAFESNIQELEEGLDCLGRCLIKTRVALLNNLSY